MYSGKQPPGLVQPIILSIGILKIKEIIIAIINITTKLIHAPAI